MKIERLLCALVLGLGLTLAAMTGLGGNLPLARAATYNVTNPNASGPGSLRQAILDANSNAGHDTIDVVITGTIVLTDALPAIVEDLTIAGPGAEQLAVSGANAYRVFTINNGIAVTITGVSVRDGNADYGGGIWSASDLHLSAVHILSNSANFGGGVYVEQGSATLSGTQLINNTAGQSGGGVYIEGGNVTLNETQVLSNAVPSYGGGVYVEQGSATLSGTQVLSNSASHGGGVHVQEGRAVLTETQVTGNSATYGGGVCVYLSNATLDISGGLISNNASAYGGGVHMNEGSTTLSGTKVLSNTANTDGGGIYVYQGNATLNGAQVVSNSAYIGGGMFVNLGDATLNKTQIISNAANIGGGLVVGTGSTTLSETQVISNSAASGGGVFVAQNDATLNVSGGTVNGNTASGVGGGVYIQRGSVTLSGTQVLSNSALYSGGGVHILAHIATLNMSGGTISSNTANYGGGAYVDQGSTTLNGTQVVSNSANESGGGVYIKNGSATLSDTQVIRNSSVYSGGGVYVEQGSATLNVSGGTISSNVASNCGGGVYVYQGSATLSDTHILDNNAANGGGLYQETGSITATNGCIVNNADVSVVHAGGLTLAATANWWGIADGPSGDGPGSGDSVSTGVDYSGFLTTPPPGCPNLAPDLVIVKTVTPTVAGPGQTITYTLVLHNAGLRTATGVIISDTIPVSVTHSSLDVESSVSITATGSVSYVWETANLAPGASGTITITGVLSNLLGAGAFANTATVSSTEIDADSGDNSSSAWLTLNQVPVAHAGNDQSVDTQALVALDGSGSSDPDNDYPLTYNWTQTGGPGVNFNSALSITTFTAPSDPAVLTFTLTVIDSLGLPAPVPDEVVISVNNQPPAADAGSDQSVDTQALVALDGSGSSDPDSDYPLTYNWTQTGGPGVSFNPALSITTFTAPSDPAVLTFTLAVIDSLSLPAPMPDEIVITINNQPPAADAGSDQSVTTDTLVALDGSSSSDPDGDYPLSYLWTQTGGPAVTLSNPTGSGPAFIAPSDPAVLSFTLVVTDSLGLNSTPDEVVVTVNARPVADAGSDQSVDTSAVVILDGSASSDPDGNLPLTYKWMQTGGPGVSFNPVLSITTFTAPSDPAVFTFTLAVTDSLGLPDLTPDEVVITINNQPPVADAGSDQSVDMDTLVALDGSASNDPDDDYPLSFLWTQTGGTAVTLSNPAGASPAFIAPSDPAILTFTLVVTDSLGLGSTPDTVVVIAGIDNQPPVADAGSDQSTDASAVVILDGSASSDPDGNLPLTYNWMQTGGPSVNFNPALSITTFTAPSDPAVLIFTLVVTDSLGMADPTPDEVVITVAGFHIYLPLVVRQTSSGTRASGSPPTRQRLHWNLLHR